jgi:hypothetical protein
MKMLLIERQIIHKVTPKKNVNLGFILRFLLSDKGASWRLPRGAALNVRARFTLTNTRALAVERRDGNTTDFIVSPAAGA